MLMKIMPTLVLIVVHVEVTMTRQHDVKPFCKHSVHYKEHRAVHSHSTLPPVSGNMSEDVNKTHVQNNHKSHPLHHTRKKIRKHWTRSKPWKKLANKIFELNQSQKKHHIHHLISSNSTPGKHEVIVALINPVMTNSTKAVSVGSNGDQLYMKHTECFERFDNQEGNMDRAAYDEAYCTHLKKGVSHHDVIKQKYNMTNDIDEHSRENNLFSRNNLEMGHNITSESIETLKQDEMSPQGAVDMNPSNLTSNSVEVYRHKTQVALPVPSKLQSKGEKKFDRFDKNIRNTSSDKEKNQTKNMECCVDAGDRLKTLAEVATRLNCNLLDSIQPKVSGAEIDKFGAVKDLNLLRLNVSDIVRIETKISVKKNVNTSEGSVNKNETVTQKYVITNLKVEKDNIMDHLDDMVKQSANKVMLMDKSILDEYLSKKASNGTLKPDNRDSYCAIHKYGTKSWKIIALILLIFLIFLILRYSCERCNNSEMHICLDSDEEQGQKEKLIRFKIIPSCSSPKVVYKTFDSHEATSKQTPQYSQDQSFQEREKNKQNQCVSEHTKYNKDQSIPQHMQDEQDRYKRDKIKVNKQDQCVPQHMKHSKHQYSPQPKRGEQDRYIPDHMKVNKQDQCPQHMRNNKQDHSHQFSPQDRRGEQDRYIPDHIKINNEDQCVSKHMRVQNQDHCVSQHMRIDKQDQFSQHINARKQDHQSQISPDSIEPSSLDQCSSRTRKLFNEFRKYEGSLFKDFSESLNHKRNKFQHKCNTMIAKNRRESVGDELLEEIDIDEECKERELDIYNYEVSRHLSAHNPQDRSKRKYWWTHQQRSHPDRRKCKLGSKSRKSKSNRLKNCETKSEFSQ